MREFERWYADGYGVFSKRAMTSDGSSEADDEREIRMLDAEVVEDVECGRGEAVSGRRFYEGGLC